MVYNVTGMLFESVECQPGEPKVNGEFSGSYLFIFFYLCEEHLCVFQFPAVQFQSKV